jgi:hypothetical protein
MHPEKVMTQPVCPACRKKLPEGGVTRCPACGAKLAGRKPAPAGGKRGEEADPGRAPGPRPKKRKRKAEQAGLTDKQKLGLLVGGGGLLLSLVLVGGLVFWLVRRIPHAGPGSSGGGRYAVVDSLASPPAAPGEEPAPPLDTEDAPAPRAKVAPAKPAWSVKPDPPSGDEKPPADAVGALSPEPSLLLASLGGPYAVGVPPDPEHARRAKAPKGPDGKPGGLVSIDKEPHPVLDIRTGKPAGRFPAEARITSSCRLSPDGRYLASFAFEVQQAPQWKILKDELVVWQRDADQPACRWPLPGPVLWTDFLGPDRLALYHTTPKPQLVVLDVAKGTPVVTAPLPADDFSPEHDHLNPRKEFSSYRVHVRSGAVSPGRRLIALGGRTNIVLVDADGHAGGKLPVEQVFWARNYLGMSFNEDGTQLRALTQQGGGGIYLRVWSLADGQTLHKTRFPYLARPGEDPLLDHVPGPAILSGPDPNTLIVGYQVFDLAAGQVLAELPYQPQRWVGPDRLLALGTLNQAANAKELGDTADFVPRGKSLVVAAFDRKVLAAKPPKPRPPVVATGPGEPPPRPAPAQADRSKVTAVRLQPPAEWAVKPGAEAARPTGTLPQWPAAFGDTEAAVLTPGLSWVRYDLNTGKTIGEPIALWPAPAPSRPGERVAPPTAALTRDGKRLALIDPADHARVDVWDTTGKRLIGLRPYQDDPILWLGWSADGKLLTADGHHLSGWDVATGQAALEVGGKFAWFVTAPGAEWVMVTTPARHLFFVDASTGRCLGHLPASPSFPEPVLSPDGKTLLRLGRWLNAQVWDLQTGKRKSDRERPLVPVSLAIPDQPQPVAVGRRGAAPQDPGVREPMLGVFWIGPQLVLSYTKSPAEQQPRYYLYDLDAHTHTYRYPPNLGPFRNDPLGRPWMSVGGKETWTAPDVPGAGPFKETLALGPGSTIRVEYNVGDRKVSQRAAEKAAGELHALGFKIGRDGWVLRADYTTGTASTNLSDFRGQRGLSVATLEIQWRLLDPEGNEAWQGKGGGQFDPFRSKYVVVGSRRTEMAPGGMGGGSTSVQLDYEGKDARTAQLEEILENTLFFGSALPGGMPTCLVKKEGGYTALPLEAPAGGKPKP